MSTIQVQVPHKVKHNKGLEGVAYDTAKDVFYVVQEKTPMSVMRVHRNGTAVEIWDSETYMNVAKAIAGIKCAAL